MKTTRKGVFETNSSSTHAIAVAFPKIKAKSYFNLGGAIRRGKIRFDFDRIDWDYSIDTFYAKLQYFTVLRLADKFGCWDSKLRPGDVENDPDMLAWEKLVCDRLACVGVKVDGFDYSECYVYGKNKYDCDDEDEDESEKPEVTKDTAPAEGEPVGELTYDIDHGVVEEGPDSAGEKVIEDRFSSDFTTRKDSDQKRPCICENSEKPKDIDILFDPDISIFYGWDSYPWADDFSENPAKLPARPCLTKEDVEKR